MFTKAKCLRGLYSVICHYKKNFFVYNFKTLAIASQTSLQLVSDDISLFSQELYVKKGQGINLKAHGDREEIPVLDKR